MWSLETELLDEAADGIGVVRDRCMRRRIVRATAPKGIPGDDRVRVGERLELQTPEATVTPRAMQQKQRRAPTDEAVGNGASLDVDGEGVGHDARMCPAIQAATWAGSSHQGR